MLVIVNKLQIGTFSQLFYKKKKFNNSNNCISKNYVICIPESFNTNISLQLFDYKITFVYSQFKKTNSKRWFYTQKPVWSVHFINFWCSKINRSQKYVLQTVAFKGTHCQKIPYILLEQTLKTFSPSVLLPKDIRGFSDNVPLRWRFFIRLIF